MIADQPIISWQPVLTDHQAFTLDALAKQMGRKMQAKVLSFHNPIRKEQGWTNSKMEAIEIQKLPADNFFKACYYIIRENINGIHIFCSPFENVKLMAVLLMATRMGVKPYLISEPYSTESDDYFKYSGGKIGELKKLLRPIVYRFYGHILSKSLSGVFAISQLAHAQYISAGIPRDRIYPFGYFIPKNSNSSFELKIQDEKEKSTFRVVFVGSLIKRKGYDLVQMAFSSSGVREQQLSLDMYGPGDDSTILTGQHGINYCGVIKFGEAQRLISNYHLLVVPSRFDGWAVVVNEAICAQVPVLCSDRVGAGNMAVKLGCGLTFKSGDPGSLAEVLGLIASNISLYSRLKAATITAAKKIQPEIAARYMNEIITAQPELRCQVIPPWME
jgi:glycosyltransferase involved in cell wall biosynthesis